MLSNKDFELFYQQLAMSVEEEEEEFICQVYNNNNNNRKKIHWQVAREGIHPSTLAAYDKAYEIWKHKLINVAVQNVCSLSLWGPHYTSFLSQI